MRKVCLAAVLSAVIGQVCAAEVNITLLPHVRVGAGPVTLGQVAHIRGTDLALVRALVHLPIGRAPAAGQSVVLEREALASWIRQRVPMPAVLAWLGWEQSRVYADSRTVTGAKIAETASRTLRDWLATRSERSEVQLAWMPRDIDAPADEVRLQTRSLGLSPVRSRMVVWVDVWAAGRFVRSVPVSFAVNAWREVDTAKQALEPGRSLDPSVVVRRQVDVAALEGAPLAVPKSGEPMQLRRGLAVGAPLLAQDVTQTPLVQRGQWVSLRSGAGAVVSEARVEVLQDGRAGESVRVRQPGAVAQVMARVVGPGQLEVAR